MHKENYNDRTNNSEYALIVTQHLNAQGHNSAHHSADLVIGDNLVMHQIFWKK